LNQPALSALEALGLCSAEAKIYLALVELGTTKAGGILKRTGLPNSVVHLTLGKLVERGFASFIKKGQVRFYQGCDLKTILRLIDERRHSLETLLPELIAKQNKQERQEAEVFEGLAGLKTVSYQLIEDAEPGDEYLFFSFYTPDENAYREVYEFYEQFERERLSRGIKIRGIAPEAVRFRMGRRRLENILFVDVPTLQNLNIFRNKVLMSPWEDRQVSFLITSRQLAENFRQYFYSIWNQYRRQ